MSGLAGKVTVELDEADAREFARYYAAEFGGDGPHSSNRVARQIAKQMDLNPYRVHEGEQAYVIFENATSEAAATILKAHFPDAQWMAAQLCNRLNGRPNF